MRKIYFLADPRKLEEPVYVGSCQGYISQRLGRHIYTAKREDWPVSRWMRRLLAEGVRPIITLIEESNDPEAEAFYTKYFREEGYDLLNVVEGKGSHGRKFSEDTRAKISNFRKNHTGWKHSEATRQKIRDSHRSKKRGTN